MWETDAAAVIGSMTTSPLSKETGAALRTMNLEFWYLFPIAMLVSTVAISSGVNGSTFFTPIFVLGLGLPLRVAIAAALTTASFGFASGLLGYARRRLIDYRLGARLMGAAIPMALIGVWSASRIDTASLRLVLSATLLLIAMSFWRREPGGGEQARGSSPADVGRPNQDVDDPAALGQLVPYVDGALLSGAGGYFLGLVSAGLGELNAYLLLRRCGLPPARAIATSVLVVSATVIAAATGHLTTVAAMGPGARDMVASVIVFTIPGVVIGAQIGCVIGSRAPRRAILRALGILFALVAVAIAAPVLGLFR